MSPMPESTPSIAVSATHDVLGACPHDCPDTCSLVTTVQDGIAIKVHGNPAHPHTDGALCTKVSRYTERTYHPERILHPLKRIGPKGSGQFERVTWDAALDDIAQRLVAIRNQHGGNAFATAGGGGQGNHAGGAFATARTNAGSSSSDAGSRSAGTR